MTSKAPAKAEVEEAPVVKGAARRRKRGLPLAGAQMAARAVVHENRDIAIVGLSGRYPQAANIDAFWRNLQTGVDCVTEIPVERWNREAYADNLCQWGGFIENADKFDPLFFNISPREADYMDPQERLFLQCVYHTMEDAGYTRESLARNRKGPANVGVFVGVMYEEYQLYGAQAQAQGWQVATAGSPSSIANRVSYWCNFRGPSMAVDTMCSSSLTAIHLAVQHLNKGSCDAAIAGGVNLSVHPNKYVLLGQGNFTSSKGRCESFGEGGDGYVPGEGVGAVLLKPLGQAQADCDQIYAVIKSTAVNHGGKTNGYTVPNPVAQGEVIGEALKQAQIDPRSISYIEAHGTGTSLGDPIEITGLGRAFGADADKGFCAIGSVKSNIGHLEAAAGIAGISKILLQMKHRTLVPSLHSETLNPNIDFAETPFVVQRELANWDKPKVEVDGKVREYPRIAGLSSFGAGGSNAHIILQEYEAPANARQIDQPALLVLSAKSAEQLSQQAANLLAHVEAHQLGDSDLYNLCFTLQVGREAMEERAATMVDSMAALKQKLEQLADGKGWYRGSVSARNNDMALFGANEELAEAVDKWVARGKYDNLLEFWAKGLPF